jgi:hypothetical protein
MDRHEWDTPDLDTDSTKATVRFEGIPQCESAMDKSNRSCPISPGGCASPQDKTPTAPRGKGFLYVATTADWFLSLGF